MLRSRALIAAAIITTASVTAAADPDELGISSSQPEHVALSLAEADAPGAAAVPSDDVQPSQQPDDVSDEDIDTFAEIYVELQRMARRYERDIAKVNTAQEAQEMHAEMQKDSIESVEKRGWSMDKFDRVAKALNRRPDLVEKALRKIEEKS